MRSVSIQAVDGHRLVPVSRRLRFTASGRIDVQCSAVQCSAVQVHVPYHWEGDESAISLFEGSCLQRR